MTTEEQDDLARRWREHFSDLALPHKYRLLTPLPRRVRFRLWRRRRVDLAAIWLVRHRRFRAAVALWRAFGMWRR
jgi:hypothetical protein